MLKALVYDRPREDYSCAEVHGFGAPPAGARGAAGGALPHRGGSHHARWRPPRGSRDTHRCPLLSSRCCLLAGIHPGMLSRGGACKQSAARDVRPAHPLLSRAVSCLPSCFAEPQPPAAASCMRVHAAWHLAPTLLACRRVRPKNGPPCLCCAVLEPPLRSTIGPQSGLCTTAQKPWPPCWSRRTVQACGLPMSKACIVLPSLPSPAASLDTPCTRRQR